MTNREIEVLWQLLLIAMYVSVMLGETTRDTFDALDTTLCKVDQELNKMLVANA